MAGMWRMASPTTLIVLGLTRQQADSIFTGCAAIAAVLARNWRQFIAALS
jgi:hypothetical protein